MAIGYSYLLIDRLVDTILGNTVIQLHRRLLVQQNYQEHK